MDASHGTSGFLERTPRVGERVEHRCAMTAEDKELVYRTRHIAYSRHNLLQTREDGRIFDEYYDDLDNCYNIMTFLDDAFASSFRLHIDSGKDAILPSLGVFSDVLTPILGDGRVVLDVTRIAMKLEYAARFPELPFLTIRAVTLAAEHFGADVITLECFGDEQEPYRRVFGFESLCLPRSAPQFSRAIACMALDYPAKRERIENRYPFFRSTEPERRSIYGRA
jgi:hypothetical protein